MEILFSPKAGIFFRLWKIIGASSVLLLSGTVLIWAESNLKISGQTFDRITNRPLGGANLQVVETGNRTTTDPQGKFLFYDLPAGNYRLLAGLFSYQTETLTVKIPAEGAVQLEILLQPQPITGPPVVVTAKSLPEPAFLPSLVFNRVDLERFKNLSVAQFLSRQPGLDIKTGGVYGSTEEITIRGSAANQVLVLLDGRPLNSSLGGTADMSFVPIAALDKIEVYKGSQTARFGPDAVAGAIVLISKKPETEKQLSPRFQMERGSFAYQSTVLESNFPAFGQVEGNLFYQNLSTTGNFSYRYKNQNLERANSYIWMNRTNGKLAYRNFETAFFWAKARRGLPGDVLNLTPNGNEKDERYGLTLNFKPLLGSGWFFEPLAGWEKLTQRFKLPDGYVKTDTRYLSERKKLEVQSGRRLPSRLSQINLDYTESSLKGEDFIRPPQSLGKTVRRSGGASSLAERQISIVSFLTGSASGAFRADWTDFTAPAYSPLFSGALNFDKKIKARVFGSWGKSFRLPTLDALFWKEDVFAAGNPNLLPEQAESREAGYRMNLPAFGKLVWEQTFFHNDLKNLIIWQRRFDGKFTPQNISKAKIFGREEKVGWRLPNILELEFNHTQTEPINEEDFVLHKGKQLVFRPRHIYNARISASYRFVALNLSGRWVGKRFTRAENTKFLPPYETYDAVFALTPRFWKLDWSFSLALENFTNRQYEILERYPMPGHAYRFSLEVKW